MAPTDRRGLLAEERPFAWRLASDGRAMVSWRGRQVACLTGRQAERLQAMAASGDEMALQLFLAKATGNFKRGNER